MLGQFCLLPQAWASSTRVCVMVSGSLNPLRITNLKVFSLTEFGILSIPQTIVLAGRSTNGEKEKANKQPRCWGNMTLQSSIFVPYQCLSDQIGWVYKSKLIFFFSSHQLHSYKYPGSRHQAVTPNIQMCVFWFRILFHNSGSVRKATLPAWRGGWRTYGATGCKATSAQLTSVLPEKGYPGSGEAGPQL